MPTIDIDFDVWKAITAERESEMTTENTVLRRKFGLPVSTMKSANSLSQEQSHWISDGAKIPLGLLVRHRHRDGTVHTAQIVEGGVQFDDKVYPGFSPAGVASGGSQTNGWTYWEFRDAGGEWKKVDHFRQRR